MTELASGLPPHQLVSRPIRRTLRQLEATNQTGEPARRFGEESLEMGELALSRATLTMVIGEAVPETAGPPNQIGERSLRHPDRVPLGAA